MATPASLRSSYGRLAQVKPLSGGLGIGQTAARAAPFSTTAPLCKRKRSTTKDGNKKRGVSTIYRSGPREPLSMSGIPLPKPRQFEPKIKVDAKHGLWEFFPAPGKLLWTPAETEEHGRAWTVEELRKKSWEDLHSLWWVCCKERNRLATSMVELDRSKLGFGNRELELRDQAVKSTMKAIRFALTERFYTWEDATAVARSDPEINLEGGEGEAYNPEAYEEDVDEVKGWATEDATKSADAPEVDGNITKPESRPAPQGP
ncbi:unnamed protein product [Clonostachys byssicola]|uniref:Large ribosomal subunit protein uL29m n=1 Tax=Clonostachys byssicola TaxID=160290 RepID=A0A9N9USP7_9HYPO|nr:unnamed protein product [Clonostachys byssicola]